MSEISALILSKGWRPDDTTSPYALAVRAARELEAAEAQLATIEAQLAEDGERLDALLAAARRDALREAADIAAGRRRAMRTLGEWAEVVWQNAKAKGFHEPGFNDAPPSWCANLHGEVSELWEAYRRGKLNEQCDKPIALTCAEEELADIIIRALDCARQMGIDIERAVAAKHAYNVTRPHQHGGKLA